MKLELSWQFSGWDSALLMQGSIPGQGIKILHAMRWGQKIIKQIKKIFLICELKKERWWVGRRGDLCSLRALLPCFLGSGAFVCPSDFL